MDSYMFNPEDVAKAMASSSFLKSRGFLSTYSGNLREEGTGSNFFQDNKIRSCSYVKECKGGLKAMPFYDKREKNASLSRKD